MTLFLVDTSDFNAAFSVQDLANRGIVGLTNKATEGQSVIHSTLAARVTAARNAGMKIYGAYHVVRTGNTQGQVNFFINRLDQVVPWWRNDPRFILQVDLERWPYDNVSAQTGIDFKNRLQAAVPHKKILLYASYGQYGSLGDWTANYFDNAVGNYLTLYNNYGGDGSYAWYNFKFWQFTQNGLIGGYRGDVNAFRGSLQDLDTLLGITAPAARSGPTIETTAEGIYYA